jgi:hypothetical protein
MGTYQDIVSKIGILPSYDGGDTGNLSVLFAESANNSSFQDI